MVRLGVDDSIVVGVTTMPSTTTAAGTAGLTARSSSRLSNGKTPKIYNEFSEIVGKGPN